MKYIFNFLLLFVLIFNTNCASKRNMSPSINDIKFYNLNGKVNTIKTEIFQITEKNDTIKVREIEGPLPSEKNYTLKFNKIGKLLYSKEFYPNGKLKYEKDYEYDDKNRIKKYKEIDYYGKTSFYEYEYIYDSNDSLSKMIFSGNNGFKQIYKVTRDKKNRPIKGERIINDTTKYIYEVKYDKKNNTIQETEYESITNHKKLLKKTERTFSKHNRNIKEVITDNRFLMPNKFENQLILDRKKRLIIARYVVENDSADQYLRQTYYKNGKIKTYKSYYYGNPPFIMEHHNDKNGNPIEATYTKIISDKKRIVEKSKFKYKYDKNNNWIEKIIYNEDKPTYIIKRNITYYD